MHRNYTGKILHKTYSRLTSATISAALPLGLLMIGTVPNVTHTENKLDTMVSIILSISVSLTSPLFMAKKWNENQFHTSQSKEMGDLLGHLDENWLKGLYKVYVVEGNIC